MVAFLWSLPKTASQFYFSVLMLALEVRKNQLGVRKLAACLEAVSEEYLGVLTRGAVGNQSYVFTWEGGFCPEKLLCDCGIECCFSAWKDEKENGISKKG